MSKDKPAGPNQTTDAAAREGAAPAAGKSGEAPPEAEPLDEASLEHVMREAPL